jgi:hypothetical protein
MRRSTGDGLIGGVPRASYCLYFAFVGEPTPPPSTDKRELGTRYLQSRSKPGQIEWLMRTTKITRKKKTTK